MNYYIDPNTVKILIDSLIYETEAPITVSTVLKKLVKLKYGDKPIINIIDGSFLDSSSIETLKEVIKVYEQTQKGLFDTINELIAETTDMDELQDCIEELDRTKELIRILKSMVKDNIKYTGEEEEYIFLALEDPDRAGETILSRDVSEEESEIVLKHLLKMEELVKSQLHAKGKFDIRSKGNGMHNHGKNPSHTLYKHVGDMIRIQVRRAGKKGNIIAVLAISPPSEVHRNANSEDTRLEMYRRREKLLDDYLNNCEKDEDGTYIISEEELNKLQNLYENFKIKLRDNIKEKQSDNLDALSELCNKISKNLDKIKEEEAKKVKGGGSENGNEN